MQYTRDSSFWTVNQASNLNSLLRIMQPGDWITLTGTWLLDTTLQFPVNGVFVQMFGQFVGQFKSKGLKNHGALVTGNGVTMESVPGLTTFTDIGYDALLVQGNDFTGQNLFADGYGLANDKNVTAAYFAYNPAGPVCNFNLIDCGSRNGYGNVFRIGGVRKGSLIRGRMESNLCGVAKSAEGMTINADDFQVIDLYGYKTAETGVLVWSGPHQNILIKNSTFVNCSQAILPPPLGTGQVGSNSAIEIDLQGGTCWGLQIINTTAYNEIGLTPTMGQTITAGKVMTGIGYNGSAPGLVIKGYRSRGLIYELAGQPQVNVSTLQTDAGFAPDPTWQY